MANALTAYSQNETKLVTGEIRQIELNTDTSGTADPIVLKGGGFDQAVLEYAEIPTKNALSDEGFAVAVNVKLTFTLLTLGETGGGTFANEMSSNSIAYLKVTWLDGRTMTLDSGTTGQAIMFFRKELVSEAGAALGWRFTGARKVAVSTITIT